MLWWLGNGRLDVHMHGEAYQSYFDIHAVDEWLNVLLILLESSDQSHRLALSESECII
jgi:hypothetical protein